MVCDGDKTPNSKAKAPGAGHPARAHDGCGKLAHRGDDQHPAWLRLQVAEGQSGLLARASALRDVSGAGKG